MTVERRTARTEFRADPGSMDPEGLPRRFWARVVTYNVIDDYGTEFAPGCFTQSLTERMPRLQYGHNGWSDIRSVLGRGIQSMDQPDGLDVLFEFDDPDIAPTVRQVIGQLMSGTLDQFSVGFVRLSPMSQNRITSARLGEVSIVIEGAVPGTKLLAFTRAANGAELMVPVTVAARILAEMGAGTTDLYEALGALKEHAGQAALAASTKTPDAQTGDDDEPVEPLETTAEEIAATEAAAVASAALDAELAEALAETTSLLAY